MSCILYPSSRSHHFNIASLHWLKIEQRIQYKVIAITYDILHNSEVTYLHRLITSWFRGFTRSDNYRCLCSLLPLRLKFSDHSFCNAAPHQQNNLPPSLRSYFSCNFTSCTALSFPQLALSHLHFLSHLKTHLFTLSYLP